MKLNTNESVVVGNLRFAFEYRATTWDRGAVIRVFVREGGRERQALKFDPFERGAHYHLDPDGRNVVRAIKEANPLDWTVTAISEELLNLLSEAGYGQAIVNLAQQEVKSVVPNIEAVLANLMPA